MIPVLIIHGNFYRWASIYQGPGSKPAALALFCIQLVPAAIQKRQALDLNQLHCSLKL